MAKLNKDEKRRINLVSEATKEISGLLKVVAEVSEELGRDGDWNCVGSLQHIRQELINLMIGHFCGDDGDERVARRKIMDKARKEADWMVKNGAFYRRSVSKWASIPD